jgi:hypothetical protein
MIEELKIKVENKLSELVPLSQVNDNVINLLKTDHVRDYSFTSHLRILPFEMVERLGIQILEDENEFQKHYKSDYDVFATEWESHHEKYWEDKLMLLEYYTTPIQQSASPMETYIEMAKLMIKIERRSILLTLEVKPVTQKHSRLSGDQKEYKVLRSYWVDDHGERKRLITRHIGDRYENLEKEIANLFISRGFAVHRNYKSDKGFKYDLVVERDRMKSVVEIKAVNEDIFNQLFLFDELSKKFAQDYPYES